MLSLLWKQTLARRARLALTGIAVTLGVTFVTGALVLTDTAQRAFDDQFGRATAGVDLTVRDAVAFDSAMGVEVARDPLEPTVLDTVREIDGVATAEPVVKGSGLISTDGDTIVPSGPSVLSSWLEAPLGAFTLREGRAPTGAADVVLDVSTAHDHRINVGDRVTITAEQSRVLTVVGLAGFGDADGLPNSTVALVNTVTAQQLLDMDTGVSEIAVILEQDARTATVQGDLSSRLGEGLEVASSRDIAAASVDSAKTQLAYIEITLLALAGAALLIGAFLIGNTFAIVVSQRTRELAVLRAAGATGRQVVTSVLGEAVVVGLLGSLAGTGLGVVAALGLRALVSSLGVAVPESGLVVLPRTVLLGVLVGVLVTVLAAVGPSRRAARVSPVTGMRSSEESTAGGRGRRILGAGTAVLALSGTAVGLTAAGSPILVGGAAVAAVFALVAWGPLLVPRLVRTAGRLLASAGVPGTLARESGARSPRRIASTVTALALSLALISFMAVLGATVRSSVAASYQETIAADLVVESARNEMLGGLPPVAHHHIQDLPEVETVSRLRYGHWKDGTTTRALTAVDPATLPQVTDLDMVDGELADLGGDGILLAEGTATARRLEVGDPMTMTFSRTGTRKLTVVGLVDDADAQALSTDYLISLDTYARLFSERMDASLFVTVAENTTLRAAQAALEDALAGIPTAEVRDQAAAVDGRTTMIDQVIGLVSALLLFTVLIAMLGITNTLALSIVERTREIGMLRAVGMTRRQVRRMVRAEAVLVAAAALVIGGVLGVGYAVATATAIGRTTPVTLTVPTGTLLGVLLLAAGVGVLAGIAPARRAAKLDVLTAIAAE
jgi:putative ABC transport system permease protein